MRLIGLTTLCFSLLLLQACTSVDDSPELSPRPDVDKAAALAIKPGYRVGVPYRINGKRYRPREAPAYSRTGTASWYGDLFHGRLTANGEIFDMHAMTAAHKTLPLPTIVRVTNLQNSKSLIVRVNDRGPFVNDRIIDLSKAAAEALGFRKKGTARVRVEVLPDANRQLRAMAEAKSAVGKMQSYVAALNLDKPDGRPRQLAQAPIPRAPDGNWYLQAAAFGNPANARRAEKKLDKIGPTLVVSRTSGNRTLYLVRVGPYGDKEQAQFALKKVHKVGFEDALLVASG